MKHDETVPRRKFPIRSLAIALVSAPFWYAFFRAQGVPSGRATMAVSIAAAIVAITSVLIWLRSSERPRM